MITSQKTLKRIKDLREKRKIEETTFQLETYLFDKQLAFVRDPNPNKVAVCSRRSGKTTACAADLVYTAINHENVVCLYITLSRNNAKKIIWKEIKTINRTYDLKGEENLSELSMTFPNGSVIYLSGAKDTNEIEKFRGLALKLVYIDECQSFREYLGDLINDVLSPALMDYAGTLNLIGTPGAIPTGYFHDCAEKTGTWSHHDWTFFDNPFITLKSKLTHQQMLDRELTRRGVSASDPSIQREWFGKWVLDSESLLLRYNEDKNDFAALPTGNYTYIMGIDLGFNDADAIAVLAWSDTGPDTYLVEELVVEKQGLTELVEQIQVLRDKYKVVKMVIDEGGLGKKLAEEMRRRHRLPVQAADKVRKMENIAFLNDSLRTGRFRAKAKSKFAQDSYLVEIDKDKTTPDKIKVSSKYHSDIIDAVLYAFKESPAFAYTPPEVKPEFGSKQWADKEQAKMWEKAQEHFEEQKELHKRYNGDFE